MTDPQATLLCDSRTAELLKQLRAFIRTVGSDDPSTADSDRLALDSARFLHALHQQDHAQAETILRELSAWMALRQDDRAMTIYLLGYERVRYRRYGAVGQLVYIGSLAGIYLDIEHHIYRLDVLGDQTVPVVFPPWERVMSGDANIYGWRNNDDMDGRALTNRLIALFGAAGVQATAMVRALLSER